MDWWEGSTREVIKTEAQLDEEFNLFMKEVKATKAFSDMSKKGKEKRKNQAEKDKLNFCKTYLPVHFREDYSPFHHEWPAISEIENKINIIMAMREAGKSTFFLLGDALYNICYGKRKYLLLVGVTEKISIPYAKRILVQLLGNPRIEADFGKVTFKGLGKKAFGDFELSFENDPEKVIKVKAISIGQSPRGFITDEGYRPDWVVMDDIQDDEKVKERDWVKNACRWILRSLYPALADGKICRILATPIGKKCIVGILEKGFEGSAPIPPYRFPAQENSQIDGKPTYSAKYPMKRLIGIMETIGKKAYKQEFLLIGQDDNEKVFNVEDLKKKNLFEKSVLNDIQFDCIVSHLDPTPKPGDSKRCYKSIITLGFLDSVAYIIGCWIRKDPVEHMIDEMFNVYSIWNNDLMTFEDNGGQALLDIIFKYAAKEKKHSLPLQAVTSTKNKDLRIQGLAYPFRNINILFCEEIGDTTLLLEEADDYPGGYKDGLDALKEAYDQGQQLLQSLNDLPEGANPYESTDMLEGYC